MGKRGRKGLNQGETPAKGKLQAQEDSKFVSPNFKPLIGSVQEGMEANEKSGISNKQSSSQYIQNKEEEQETFYHNNNGKEQKAKEDDFKFNKINNILFNETQKNSMKQTSSSSYTPQARQNKQYQDNSIEDAKSNIIKQRRFIEQLQMRQSQLQSEDYDIDYAPNSLDDSELKLSNLRLNNSFQTTQRNHIVSCSNSKQKEKEDIQSNNYIYSQNNYTQHKESVKNLIENLSTEEMAQLKQQIDLKLSSKGNKKHDNERGIQKQQNQKEKELHNVKRSPSPFSSKIKQFMQIKERIIGENKSLKQSTQQKSSQDLKEQNDSTNQKGEINQNIKKQLYNEFKTVQQEEMAQHQQIKQQQPNHQYSKSSANIKNNDLESNLHYFSKHYNNLQKITGGNNNRQEYEIDNGNTSSHTPSYINARDSYSTNPTRDLLFVVGQNQSNPQIHLENIIKRNKQPQQINTSINNQYQQEEFGAINNHINRRQYDQYLIDPQSKNCMNDSNLPKIENDNNKNCFDTFCMNESLNNRSFSHNQQNNNQVKNENILEFYHKEQQKYYPTQMQVPQANQIKEYQMFSSNQTNRNDSQSTLRNQFYSNPGLANGQINQVPIYNATIQKQKQLEVKSSLNYANYRDENQLKENQSYFSNFAQHQTKKNECDEYETEIVDLLNNNGYRKREQKQQSPLPNKTFKKPKSLERQAHHNQFMQNFLLNNESRVETQDLLQRYNKLVGQISDKLKAKDMEKHNQQKKKPITTTKNSFRC